MIRKKLLLAGMSVMIATTCLFLGGCQNDPADDLQDYAEDALENAEDVLNDYLN